MGQLIRSETVVSVRIGRQNDDPLTLGELRDIVGELLRDGWSEDTRVNGATGLMIFERVPALSPAEIHERLRAVKSR